MIGNRVNEKKRLEEYYAFKESCVCIAYGRSGSQIGELMRDFAKGRPAFYYCPVPASEKEQCRYFAKEISTRYNLHTDMDTYGQVFNTLRTRDGQLDILIFDEAHLMVKKDGTFFKELQKYIRDVSTVHPIMVILCTTDVSWVREEEETLLSVFGQKQLRMLPIEEFQFLDAVRIFPGATVRQCIQIYGVVGGVADYMECWDQTKSIKQNICEQILSPKGYLYHEPERFLKTQLRETALYETILSALASGKNKLNDLFKYTDFSRAKISVYLNNLMAFDVVEKVYSFESGGYENAQKGIYQIKDTFLNFWYRFVYPNMSQLKVLSPEEFYDRYITPDLELYTNRYFVKVCGEYLELMGKVGQLPMQIHKMGTWRGKEGTLDIVIQNEIRENLVGICSWSRGEMTYATLTKLMQTLEQARLKASYIYLFCAGTFDVRLIEAAAKDDSIVLVDMNSL